MLKKLMLEQGSDRGTAMQAIVAAKELMFSDGHFFQKAVAIEEGLPKRPVAHNTGYQFAILTSCFSMRMLVHLISAMGYQAQSRLGSGKAHEFSLRYIVIPAQIAMFAPPQIAISAPPAISLPSPCGTHGERLCCRS